MKVTKVTKVLNLKDMPIELMKLLKVRAVNEGKTIRELVIEILGEYLGKV